MIGHGTIIGRLSAHEFTHVIQQRRKGGISVARIAIAVFANGSEQPTPA
jgi:hypothetical protein